MPTISAIPSYSDLGEADNVTKNAWEQQLARYSKYEYYFTGEVFREKVDDSEVANPPSIYPVGINIVKMLCQSLADATYGEWDQMPFTFATRKGIDQDNHTKEASETLNGILHACNGESSFLEMEIHRMLYGNSVLKIRPTQNKYRPVEWYAIKPSHFFPVFDPNDKNILIAATVMTHITRAQAKMIYGYETNKDEVLFEEYWDLHEHFVKLDKDHRIAKYSGRNPYGLVPFVYIPRMRSTSIWGDSIADDIIPVQDELNMRIADIGEAINVNAHPIRWGKNLPQSFTAKNFPVDSDVLWDLGRSFGEHQPEVGVLEIDNPIPSGAFDNIEWLYDWVRTSTFAPPIAFGEDTGGGQRSGITLEIRMLPLIKAVRKHRAYLRSGLRRAIYITGRILSKKDLARPMVISAMMNNKISPRFDDVLPRDRAKVVDEIVKRLSTTPPSISLETALKRLGADSIEEGRIQEMIEKYGLDIEEEPEHDQDNLSD